MSKKTLSWIAGLIAVFCILTGFSQPDIEDQAHILNKETRNLITAKNARYWQTGEQPQIVVKTVNRLDKLTPKALNKSDKTVFIVVGVKGKKRNVQIYSTKDLHGAFTAEVRMNIIRAEADKLRSSNNATFNQGLRFVFRAVATKIDQEYQYKHCKNYRRHYGVNRIVIQHHIFLNSPYSTQPLPRTRNQFPYEIKYKPIRKKAAVG